MNKEIIILSVAMILVMLMGFSAVLGQSKKEASGKNPFAKGAVVVVDVQGDFTEWKKGSLAVPGTDKAYVEKVRKATSLLAKAGFTMYATQDWHPSDHVSFYTNHPGRKAFEILEIGGRKQVLWPPHCVQGTEGAKVLVDNDIFLAIVKKGQDKNFDSYSGFQDDGGAKTELDRILRARGIEFLVIYGIATDYCVRATAMDAASLGYKVVVVEELCRGVSQETTEKALEEMKSKGIVVMRSLDLEALGKFWR